MKVTVLPKVSCILQENDPSSVTFGDSFPPGGSLPTQAATSLLPGKKVPTQWADEGN